MPLIAVRCVTLPTTPLESRHKLDRAALSKLKFHVHYCTSQAAPFGGERPRFIFPVGSYLILDSEHRVACERLRAKSYADIFEALYGIAAHMRSQTARDTDTTANADALTQVLVARAFWTSFVLASSRPSKEREAYFAELFREHVVPIFHGELASLPGDTTPESESRPSGSVWAERIDYNDTSYTSVDAAHLSASLDGPMPIKAFARLVSPDPKSTVGRYTWQADPFTSDNRAQATLVAAVKKLSEIDSSSLSRLLRHALAHDALSSISLVFERRQAVELLKRLGARLTLVFRGPEALMAKKGGDFHLAQSAAIRLLQHHLPSGGTPEQLSLQAAALRLVLSAHQASTSRETQIMATFEAQGFSAAVAVLKTYYRGNVLRIDEALDERDLAVLTQHGTDHLDDGQKFSAVSGYTDTVLPQTTLDTLGTASARNAWPTQLSDLLGNAVALVPGLGTIVVKAPSAKSTRSRDAQPGAAFKAPKGWAEQKVLWNRHARPRAGFMAPSDAIVLMPGPGTERDASKRAKVAVAHGPAPAVGFRLSIVTHFRDAKYPRIASLMHRLQQARSPATFALPSYDFSLGALDQR